jgi:hypothetical protein
LCVTVQKQAGVPHLLSKGRQTALDVGDLTPGGATSVRVRSPKCGSQITPTRFERPNLRDQIGKPSLEHGIWGDPRMRADLLKLRRPNPEDRTVDEFWGTLECDRNPEHCYIDGDVGMTEDKDTLAGGHKSSRHLSKIRCLSGARRSPDKVEATAEATSDGI